MTNNIEDTTSRKEAVELGGQEKETSAEFDIERSGSELAGQIESDSQNVIDQGTKALREAVVSLGGNEQDVQNGEMELEPLNEEVERVTDEALQKVQAEMALKLRDKWSRGALAAIERQGLTVVGRPYKSFGIRERFFIQKCIDAAGKEVVVKIAAPTEQDARSITDEGFIYDLIRETTEGLNARGLSLGIRFPQKFSEFTVGDQKGITTDFIEDDKKLKSNLNPDGVRGLLITVIREMQKMIPPKRELEKTRKGRIVDVIRADDYKRRWNYFVPDLVRQGTLSEQEGEQLLQMIAEGKDDIDSFELKIDHGDIHGGNIAYAIDRQTGRPVISVMDLEVLNISNEFAAIAQIANREELANQLYRYIDVIKKEMPELESQAEEAFGMFKNGGITASLEEEFVAKNETPDKAARVYKLMRLHEILKQLHGSVGKEDLPSKMWSEAYAKILGGLLGRGNLATSKRGISN